MTKSVPEHARADRADRAERLKMALFLGRNREVESLLSETPDLGSDNFGILCALFDADGVRSELDRDPALAIAAVGPRRPILHLAFSRHLKARPELEEDMLEVAGALIAAGADVNDGYEMEPGSGCRLSALYGALGHADNMPLARWLLEHGANPDDGESLYHSTELGHREGLKMLIAHGANPAGTNALPRALDFDDIEAVRLLLEAGADPNESVDWPEESGEAPRVIPALHQAARRMCGSQTVECLLDGGADPARIHDGHTAYALARVHGNRAAAEVLENRGGASVLSPVEAQLARAADGDIRESDRIDMAKLSAELARLLAHLAGREDALPHVERLVVMGFDIDSIDEMGLTPLHVAGWEGLPNAMACFLGKNPDLDHVNGYGGTLFSTILHGSENCPRRESREHLSCMTRALESGAEIPRLALTALGEPDMIALLNDWAAAHPDQVVEGGVY